MTTNKKDLIGKTAVVSFNETGVRTPNQQIFAGQTGKIIDVYHGFFATQAKVEFANGESEHFLLSQLFAV